MCRQLKRNVKITMFLDFVFLTYKFLKSIFVNLVFLLLGFILGFGYVVSKDHMKIIQSNDGKSIEVIKQCLDQHIEINKKMEIEFNKILLFAEKKEN